MKLFPLLAAATLFAAPVQADTTNAYCSLALHDHTSAIESGPCQFSQRGGTINVTTIGGTKLLYPYSEQGKTFTRINSNTGIQLNREGNATLTVLWDDPAATGESGRVDFSTLHSVESNPQ